MIKMGFKNIKGRRAFCFTCIQCNKWEVVDFRYYPVCKKCNKFNTRDKTKNKKEKEENS